MASSERLAFSPNNPGPRTEGQKTVLNSLIARESEQIKFERMTDEQREPLHRAMVTETFRVAGLTADQYPAAFQACVDKCRATRVLDDIEWTLWNGRQDIGTKLRLADRLHEELGNSYTIPAPSIVVAWIQKSIRRLGGGKRDIVSKLIIKHRIFATLRTSIMAYTPMCIKPMEVIGMPPFGMTGEQIDAHYARQREQSSAGNDDADGHEEHHDDEDDEESRSPALNNGDGEENSSQALNNRDGEENILEEQEIIDGPTRSVLYHSIPSAYPELGAETSGMWTDEPETNGVPPTQRTIEHKVTRQEVMEMTTDLRTSLLTSDVHYVMHEIKRMDDAQPHWLRVLPPIVRTHLALAIRHHYRDACNSIADLGQADIVEWVWHTTETVDVSSMKMENPLIDSAIQFSQAADIIKGQENISHQEIGDFLQQASAVQHASGKWVTRLIQTVQTHEQHIEALKKTIIDLQSQVAELTATDERPILKRKREGDSEDGAFEEWEGITEER